jgi:hypothetical protein
MSDTSEAAVTQNESSPPLESVSQQTSAGSWLDSMPESLRSAPFIKAAKNEADALQQIKNAAAHMGNSLRIPSEDSSDEDKARFRSRVIEKIPELMLKPNPDDMDAFYSSLGRPESPDKYIIDTEELPNDFELFSQTAFKHGLTQDQFRGVLEDIISQTKEQNEIDTAEHNTEMAALKSEWGEAYDQNMSSVKNFLLLSDAPEGIVEMFSEKAMSPREIKWIHSIANQTKAPVELAAQRTEQQALLTPVEARNRIQEVMNNSSHPYWNSSDPRHSDAINKMLEYQRAANPE